MGLLPPPHSCVGTGSRTGYEDKGGNACIVVVHRWRRLRMRRARRRTSTRRMVMMRAVAHRHRVKTRATVRPLSSPCPCGGAAAMPGQV